MSINRHNAKKINFIGLPLSTVKHILFIKTSSLGDIVHNFPAITDLTRNCGNMAIDWVVEEDYSSLPKLHPDVAKVIPVAIRRWRRQKTKRETFREISNFLNILRKKKYHTVIDTQGLLKSALISMLARGSSCGMSLSTAREPISFFYQKKFSVHRNQHAVERNRQLVALAMGYKISHKINYGLQPFHNATVTLDIVNGPYAVLLPSSSNKTKGWVDEYWIRSGNLLNSLGIRSMIASGNLAELEKAKELSKNIRGSLVLDLSPLKTITSILLKTSIVIGLDTGLTHLAAALGKPTIGIYSNTDPDRTGIYGVEHGLNLGGIGTIPSPEEVKLAIEKLIK